MGLTSAFACLDDGRLPESFEGLKSKLDIEWIKSALATHDVATVRNRKLAVEQVVWLVVGMGLYRDRPIAELIGRLDLVLPGPDGKRRRISKGSIPPARDRVGAQPCASCLRRRGGTGFGLSADRHRWRGLMVLGADGDIVESGRQR